MVSGMMTDMSSILCHSMHHTFVFTFLFFNQCGLSMTDVNIHSTRVCVCVCVWGWIVFMWSESRGFDICSPWCEVSVGLFITFSSCFHWSPVLILSRHLVGRCRACVFVSSGLIFCSPKGIPVTELQQNLCALHIVLISTRTNQKCLSYLLFWKLYMANGWI